VISKLIDHPGPLWRPYAALAWVILGTFSVIWGAYILALVILGTKRETQTKAIRRWLRSISYLGRVRYVVEGREHYDAAKPSLIISNHQSHMDIPAAFEAFDGDIRMVAKAELFRIPVFGQVLGATEFIPLQRGSQAASKKVSERMDSLIKSGIHVWVCPEGTRSKDGEIKDFKPGSFAIGIQTGVPIQPVVVMNSLKCFPKDAMLLRPGKTIHVKILPQVPTKGLKTEDRRALCEQVRKMMIEAKTKP
jgi:1-acyl-sn-glycerol-3-phosphate acyltransferase